MSQIRPPMNQLTPEQYAIIDLLAARGHLSPLALAEALGHHPGRLGPQIAALRRRGLVAAPIPRDGSGQILTLTMAGRERAVDWAAMRPINA